MQRRAAEAVNVFNKHSGASELLSFMSLLNVYDGGVGWAGRTLLHRMCSTENRLWRKLLGGDFSRGLCSKSGGRGSDVCYAERKPPPHPSPKPAYLLVCGYKREFAIINLAMNPVLPTNPPVILIIQAFAPISP